MSAKYLELATRVDHILDDITYKPEFGINVGVIDRAAVYIEVTQYLVPEWQTGRKWLIEDEMTDSEIVLTALKAVLTFEEHEARETFRYKGSKIFQPHLDLDILRDFAKKKDNLSLRTTTS